MGIIENIINVGSAIPVKLFFRDNRDYRVGTISFDLILTETHNFANRVTDYNIEDGSIISDHIRNELENGTLSGLISNFSLNVFGIFSNRAQDAFDELYRLWQSRELVTIITVMKVYENVAIINITVDRSEASGEAIILNVSFRQVKVVALKTVDVETSVKVKDMDSDQNKQSAPKMNLGRTSGMRYLP